MKLCGSIERKEQNVKKKMRLSMFGVMIKHPVFLFLTLLLVLIGWGIRSEDPVSAEVIDQIAAIVNADLILLSEVREASRQPAIQVIAHVNVTNNLALQQTVRYLIERQLLTQEIQALAMPREQAFGRSVALRYIITTYYGDNAAAFAEQLRIHHLTEIDLDQELAAHIKGIDYIRRKYRFSDDVDKPDLVLERFREWVAELQAQVNPQILL